MNAPQLPALKIGRLDNLTINLFAPDKAQLIEGVELRAFDTASSVPPLGSYWPGEGGHYAGLVRGENGQPGARRERPAGLLPDRGRRRGR